MFKLKTISQRVRTIILSIKNYAAMVYNIENIEYICNVDLCFRIKDIFLETLLIEIRGKTISYTSYKNKVQRETEKKLDKEFGSLENN